MFDKHSDDMLMALLAADADANAAETATKNLPTLDERVDMFARSLSADGVVTAQMRAFARQQILNAMAADLADATAEATPGNRQRQSVPLTDARLVGTRLVGTRLVGTRLAAANAKSVARIPAPVVAEESSNVLAGLLSAFTVRRLSFAAVPLVALLAAGAAWNEAGFSGGESPQQQQPSAQQPLAQQPLAQQPPAQRPPAAAGTANTTANTRGIGPQGVDTNTEQNLQRAIADEESAHGRSDPAVARKLVDLAALYRADGRLREAQALCERALIIQDRVLGSKNAETIRTINELAAIYRAEGRGKDADALLTRPDQP
ncbi:MAG TPA: tetratricopeptide repeat protein [Xanthobacteraceae bacterium]|jgi:hypothetical protein|nr:tetratricopeptide repeat protein [Xanthobacteraceae bacterium]